MGFYFDDDLSMFAVAGMRIEGTLEAIATRYLRENPLGGLTYRAYSKRGILRGKDYRYEMDFAKLFPAAKLEQCVYAWAKYWAEGATTLMADVSCLGPMVVYVNGREIFKSDVFSERYSDKRNRVKLEMEAGWNHIVVKCRKTAAGFGGVFGTWLGKHPYYFLMPTEEREGGGGQQEGWVYSEPRGEELGDIPGGGKGVAETGIRWLPRGEWGDAAGEKKGQLERVFGRVPGGVAVGWTKGVFGGAGEVGGGEASERGLTSRPAKWAARLTKAKSTRSGMAKYRLRGRHEGDVAVFVGDKEVFAAAGKGRIEATITVGRGVQDVMVKSVCPGKVGRKGSGGGTWGFELRIEDEGCGAVKLESACGIVGTKDPWIYIGPFEAGARVNLRGLRDLNRVQEAVGGKTYWRVDMPGGEGWVRPYNENKLFGKWNYPLGVTLYGLLHAGKAIGSEEVERYVLRHMQMCCDTFEYAMWDKGQYGGATTLHNLLTSIDSLDDCGSFGSAMLEVAKWMPLKGWRGIADYVADYITNKQARLEDGTFFRKTLMHVFHENTMWADDLYMCVPFLCRYAAVAGDVKYLDDAARQFLGFKKRLYIPELRVMSHVIDFRRGLATGVPWGRGNGWTIFSLSELLEVLPAKHALRGELLAFFRELCAGYLALQDGQGMWHQVLTHADAYPETSCTAMLAYAFARGARLGWFADARPYARAVMRAWEGLNRVAIDREGNVHGVCRGSEFSFSAEYYKRELMPVVNDTHGVGIVLLAGVEVGRMGKALRH